MLTTWTGDVPWWQVPAQPGPYVAPYTNLTVTSGWPLVPTECTGDIHVFPCKKCGECKCGKAKIAA